MADKHIPKSIPESLEWINGELKGICMSLYHLVILLASQHPIPEVRKDALKKMASSMGLREIISQYDSDVARNPEHSFLNRGSDHPRGEEALLKPEIAKEKVAAVREALLQCAEKLQALSDENRKIAETKEEDSYTQRMIMKAAQTYKHCSNYLRSMAEEATDTFPSSQDPEAPQL